MKRILLSTLCVLAGAVSVLGQGTVNFQNSSAQRVFLPGGTTPAPANSLSVALFWGPLGSSESQLTQLGGLGPILAPGVFIAGTRTAGGPGRQSYTFQVQAWSVGYPSYAAALASGDPSKYVGKSALFTNTTGDPNAQPVPDTPAALSGFTSFSVMPVPEPSTIILGILGASALLLRRRK